MQISRRDLMLIGVAATLPSGHVLASQVAGPTGPTSRERLRNEGRYLPRWIELLDEAGERARVAQWLGPGQAEMMSVVMRDSKAQYAALLGDEASALVDGGTSRVEAGDDLVALDAVEAIVEASRGHRVVMLNEAHTASRHRFLLGRVIEALNAEGFTHLAAETFTPLVSELRAGDQLASRHGWYIHDPVYAEAVRGALALGMRLVSYEQRQDQQSAAPGMSDEATLVREQVQADNFAAILAADPDARILVFVGYGHLAEAGPPFAARFKRDTGVDPLTIGQAGVGSFGPHGPDTPAVTALLERFRPTKPVVLLKTGQRPGSAPTDTELTAEATDLIVLHPALADIEGRPGWLAGDDRRQKLVVQTPPGEGPRLLQAIYKADVDPAIPADQVLIPNDGAPNVLFLRPGAYRLRIETPEGFLELAETLLN